MSTDEHTYLVAYDIGDTRRWRLVFRAMKGYGMWLQLSVFQCRLGAMRHAEMVATLDQIIDHEDDHVVIVDVGLAEKVVPKVVSLGKRAFEPIERSVIVV
jgi:CRISPR-associated protein Cas2